MSSLTAHPPIPLSFFFFGHSLQQTSIVLQQIKKLVCMITAQL